MRLGSPVKACKACAAIACVSVVWHAVLIGVVWYPAAVALSVALVAIAVVPCFLLPTELVSGRRMSGLLLIAGPLVVVLGRWTMALARSSREGASHFLLSVVVGAVFLVGGLASLWREARASD